MLYKWQVGISSLDESCDHVLSLNESQIGRPTESFFLENILFLYIIGINS